MQVRTCRSCGNSMVFSNRCGVCQDYIHESNRCSKRDRRLPDPAYGIFFCRGCFELTKDQRDTLAELLEDYNHDRKELTRELKNMRKEVPTTGEPS